MDGGVYLVDDEVKRAVGIRHCGHIAAVPLAFVTVLSL